MIGCVSGKFQTEIGLYRRADVRRSVSEDAPTAVFVLVAQNPVGRFLEALLIACSEQRVQQNVIRFKSRVGFELAAPVAVFVLL
jgi:hypothetical protein